MNEGRLQEWGISLRELCEGKLEGLSFNGKPKICNVILWKWASVSAGGALLVKMEGRFPRAFDRRYNFFIQENFHKEFDKYVKNAL